jgi:multidrug transporter EmrE-like cation transporter
MPPSAPTKPERALSLSAKTRLFTLIVIVSNVIGNLALSRGLHSTASLVGGPAVGYIRVLFNPWVALGVVFLIVWFLSHMTLLSWADLSYVLPVTAIGYALIALGGRVFLHESVSLVRWGGIAFIVFGVSLVGGTAPRAMPENKRL